MSGVIAKTALSASFTATAPPGAIEPWAPALVVIVCVLGAKDAAIVTHEDAKEAYAGMVSNGMDAEAAKEIALADYILLTPPEDG